MPLPVAHWPRHIGAWVLRLYQLTLSFWLGRQCRFYPTCSSYMQQAVLRFGVRRGGWLGLKRLMQCHPWARANHGPHYGPVFDPVPDSWQEAPCQCKRCAPDESL